MDAVICPRSGEKMVRGLRSMTLEFKGETVTFDMPGWYAEGMEDGIHSGEDMEVSEYHLEQLKSKSSAR